MPMSEAPLRDWRHVKPLLLLQWPRLTETDLQRTPPSRGNLARLIEEKCGVSRIVVEHYLQTLERTLTRILPA